MKDLLQKLGAGLFGGLAGAGLAAVALIGVESTMPNIAAASSVRDTLNVADMNFRVGNTDIACTMVSLAIMEVATASSSERSEIASYAKRCNLRL